MNSSYNLEIYLAKISEDVTKIAKNQNSISSKYKRNLEGKNIGTDSTNHSAPNEINTNYDDEGKDSNQILGEAIKAHLKN